MAGTRPPTRPGAGAAADRRAPARSHRVTSGRARTASPVQAHLDIEGDAGPACYNAASNDAYVREDDRSYVKLDRVDDGAIKRAGLKFSTGNLEHFASKPFVPDVGRAAAGD